MPASALVAAVFSQAELALVSSPLEAEQQAG